MNSKVCWCWFDIPGSCDSKKHESSGSKNVLLAAPTSCDSLPRTRRCSFGCRSLAPIRTRRTWRNSMKPWAPRFPRSPQPQQHQQPGHQQRQPRRAPLRLAQRQHRILIRHCGRSWRSDLDDGMGSECTFSRLKWWGEIVDLTSDDAENMPVLLFISLAPLFWISFFEIDHSLFVVFWAQFVGAMISSDGVSFKKSAHEWHAIHSGTLQHRYVQRCWSNIWSFLASYERHPPQAWSIPNEAQFLMSFSGMPMDDPPTQVLDAAASSWRNCTTCSTADDDSFDHWSATGPVDRWGSVQWLGGQVEVGWSVSKAKYNWVYLAIHMICGFHDFSCRFGKAFEVMNLVAQVRWLGFYPTAIRTRTADL